MLGALRYSCSVTFRACKCAPRWTKLTHFESKWSTVRALRRRRLGPGQRYDIPLGAQDGPPGPWHRVTDCSHGRAGTRNVRRGRSLGILGFACAGWARLGSCGLRLALTTFRVLRNGVDSSHLGPRATAKPFSTLQSTNRRTTRKSSNFPRTRSNSRQGFSYRQHFRGPWVPFS